ncbi:MAG: response regulator, partial [Proteobacteria bacterium]|nr:response regulator [Pseudomonadota bacterium]
WSNTAILDDENQVEFIIGTGVDITDKRRMEEEIAKVERLESLSVLAGGLAHDFNNLLMGITGNISLAKNAIDPCNPAVPLLEQAQRCGDEAKGLTQQLLTFAKGGEPQLRAVSLQKLLSDAASFATRGSNTRYELNIADGLPCVNGDENQLHQVFHNLFINAVQAMPNGGVIRVRAFEPPHGTDDTICVSIRDDGPGIPLDQIERIYDPFYTTKVSGSGLGLATAYSILRRHNGSIQMNAIPESGCNFVVTLPTTGEAMPESPSAIPVEYTGEQCVALVMDDDPNVREVLTSMLEYMGMDTVSVADGEEAVATFLAGETAFGLLILDLTVPGGMGGLEAMLLIREKNPEVPAIVSSGYSNDPILSRPEDFGFQGALTKPFRLAAFTNLVQQVLTK